MKAAYDLTKVSPGDRPSAMQWNMMIDILRRINITGPYVMETPAGWHIRDLPQEAEGGIALVVITRIPTESELADRLYGHFVTEDEDGDPAFDSDAEEQEFYTEFGIANTYYHYALYDENSPDNEILPVYKPKGWNRYIVIQRLRWPVMTGYPDGVPSQCQIAMQGGQYG